MHHWLQMRICSKNTVPLQEGMEAEEPYAFYGLCMVHISPPEEDMTDAKRKPIEQSSGLHREQLLSFQGLKMILKNMLTAGIS